MTSWTFVNTEAFLYLFEINLLTETFAKLSEKFSTTEKYFL